MEVQESNQEVTELSGTGSAAPSFDLCEFFTDLSIDSESAREYSKVFEDNHISRNLLPQLSESDLEKVGINSLGHRKLILKGIDDLKREKAREKTRDVVRSHPKYAAKAAKQQQKFQYKAGKQQLALARHQSKGEYKIAKKRSKLEAKKSKFSPEESESGEALTRLPTPSDGLFKRSSTSWNKSKSSARLRCSCAKQSTHVPLPNSNKRLCTNRTSTILNPWITKLPCLV